MSNSGIWGSILVKITPRGPSEASEEGFRAPSQISQGLILSHKPPLYTYIGYLPWPYPCQIPYNMPIWSETYKKWSRQGCKQKKNCLRPCFTYILDKYPHFWPSKPDFRPRPWFWHPKVDHPYVKLTGEAKKTSMYCREVWCREGY